MLKTSTIVACVLALSAPAALAQSGNWISSTMPPGPNDAAGGANGAANVRNVGTPAPSANQTAGTGTTSSSILSQTVKQESAAGVQSSSYTRQAQMRYGMQNTAQAPNDRLVSTTEPQRGPHRVAITDEYGHKYDSEGNRLNAAGYPVSMH